MVDEPKKAAILVPPHFKPTIGSFSFDVLGSESLSSTAKVAQYPKEDGEQHADDAIQDPETVTLQGLLTDTPVGAGEAEAGRAKRLLDQLLTLKREGARVSVSTHLADYPQAIITSVQPRQDDTTGYTIPVSVEIQEITIARVETAAIPKEEVEHSATPEGGADGSSGGKKSTETPDDETQQEGSTLYNLFYGD